MIVGEAEQIFMDIRYPSPCQPLPRNIAFMSTLHICWHQKYWSKSQSEISLTKYKMPKLTSHVSVFQSRGFNLFSFLPVTAKYGGRPYRNWCTQFLFLFFIPCFDRLFCLFQGKDEATLFFNLDRLTLNWPLRLHKEAFVAFNCNGCCKPWW